MRYLNFTLRNMFLRDSVLLIYVGEKEEEKVETKKERGERENKE